MKGMSFLRYVCAAVVLGGILVIGTSALAGDEPPGEINGSYARQLFEKTKTGQALTPEENRYLEKAKEARRKGQMRERPGAATSAVAVDEKPGKIDWDYTRQLLEKSRSGQTLSTTESAYLETAKRIRAQGGMKEPPGVSTQGTTSTGLIPLNQMTDQDKYKGEDGGLYGGGRNEPPPDLQQAAQKELAKIVPLGADGKPTRDGKIVLLSIGMSNTTQEFSKFKEMADGDGAKSPQVVVVDGAQGGQDAARWSEKGNGSPWKVAEERLRAAGVTAEQVQVVWMKHARMSPAAYGEFPKHADELKGHILSSLQIAKKRFSNLRVVYLSSRIYAGYATTRLNPEPYAYESAFAVRWLIQDQMKGDPQLNYDSSRGEAKAPLLLWGPYLWADGLTPRKSDGLIWEREDLAADGTHPSRDSGRGKVARLLLNFFKTNPNARVWFLKPGADKAPAQAK